MGTKYKVTFVDGSQTKVKASNKAEAKDKAESEHGKPVWKVRNDRGAD